MKTYEERLPLIDAAIETLFDFDNSASGAFVDKQYDHLWRTGDSRYQRLDKSKGYGGEYVGTREQFNQRKAELQNKPSWSDAPVWAEWLAQDEDGQWAWYQFEPIPCQAGCPWWYAEGVDFLGLSAGTVIGSWQDTLEKRPDVKVSPFSVEDYAVDADDGEVSPVSELPTESDDVVNHPNDWHKRGELPPVGYVVAFNCGSLEFDEVIREHWKDGDELEVLAHKVGESGDPVAVVWNKRDCYASCLIAKAMRPPRTETDKLVERMTDLLIKHKWEDDLGDLAEIIVKDEGWRPTEDEK